MTYNGITCICHRRNDPDQLFNQLSSLSFSDNTNIILYRSASVPELMTLVKWEQECKSYFDRFFSKRSNDIICLPQHKDSFMKTLEEWCRDTKKSNEKGALIIQNVDLLKQMEFLRIQKSEFINSEKPTTYLVYNCTENVILYLQLAEDINDKESIDEKIKRCRLNLHLLINLYRNELKNSGVTIVGIVIVNSETQNSKLNCDLCSIFLVSMKAFKNLDSCKSWWKKSIGWLKVENLDQDKKTECFLSFCSKMLGLMACTKFTYLPNFTKELASQINQACLFLTPEQVELIYYSKNRTILNGDFGTGKSIVLQKKLENLAKVIPEDEIIYYINYDGKSNVLVDVKNFVERTCSNNSNKIQFRNNADWKRLSNLFQLILNEVDKRINSVHVFVDEYNGEDFTTKEVKRLKENLHEKCFKHSIIFIATQPIHITKIKTKVKGLSLNEKIFRQKNLFHEVEGIFEIRQLDRVMRNTVQINTIAKSAQKCLKSERNSYLCFEKHARQNQVIENNFIVAKGYAYFRSEIGHQINSKIPKLVLLNQLENFFENIISYAAVLDSLKIQKHRTVIIHFKQSPPAVLTKALESLSVPFLDDVKKFMGSQDNVTLITNFQYVRGMEFKNVIVALDPGDFSLRHNIPEAITRCTTNLCLMLLEYSKKKKEIRTVVDIIKQLEDHTPAVIEKLIIETCNTCGKDSNLYCFDSGINPKRLGINKSSQKFKKMAESFNSSQSDEQDRAISIDVSKQM